MEGCLPSSQDFVYVYPLLPKDLLWDKKVFWLPSLAHSVERWVLQRMKNLSLSSRPQSAKPYLYEHARKQALVKQYLYLCSRETSNSGCGNTLTQILLLAAVGEDLARHGSYASCGESAGDSKPKRKKQACPRSPHAQAALQAARPATIASMPDLIYMIAEAKFEAKH